jgi:hypothetical protein
MRDLTPEYLDDLRDIHLSRGMRMPDPEILPAVVYIEPGVGAGMLYQTDSSICLLDGVVTHAGASRESRHAFLSEMFEQVEKDARLLGFKFIVAFASEDNLPARGVERGWVPGLKTTLYQKEL